MRLIPSLSVARRLFVTVAIAVICVIGPELSPAFAGPQHWGFGFSYLAAIEDVGGARRLVVYEPPLFCRDATWPARWLDRETDFGALTPGAIAVGDYFPSSFGTEYLAGVRVEGGNLYVDIYQPPQVFRTGSWTKTATSAAIPVTGTLLGATAGELRYTGEDQILVALDDNGSLKIVMLLAPSSPLATTWTKASEAVVPDVSGTYRGMACGDFWNDNSYSLALATTANDQTQLAFYSYSRSLNQFALITVDQATDLPTVIPGGLTSADYEKDGFDLLTLVQADGTFQLRVAPAKTADQAWDGGPEYTGASLARVPMPGNNGMASEVAMTGTFDAAADARVGVAAGRMFGYVNTSLSTRYPLTAGLDAQISFVHRSPTMDEVPPYGWPAQGATVTFDVNINNMGASAIPSGDVTLKVWVNQPKRNADTDPATADSPDYTFNITESLPAYDATNPTYISRSVTLPWPYALEPAGTGATWQRINLETVGERWVIAKLEYANDTNERNDRYELSIAGLTLHPLFRYQSSLADRRPTVQGDPASKEYLTRKLADAVQSMWERSQTLAGEQVLQRLHFDSYQIGWADDAANPSEVWSDVQSKYEGWRQLDGWWGVNQYWERFNWGDGGAELHETGHLFHPIGDLYQYGISPVWSGATTMADGTPVKLRTWCWVPDSYGSGHARISWPACEVMKRHIVGVRNNYMPSWWTLVSNETYVRVLDRYGEPVSGAEVKLYRVGYSTPFGTGVTDGDGRVRTTGLWGTTTIDAFGRRHRSGVSDDHIVTVSIDGVYQDYAVPDTTGMAAYGRYTYMGRSFTDPNEWTFDIHTNYEAGALSPDFTVEAAINGNSVRLGIEGDAGATYSVYRRWEPSYLRFHVGDYTATSNLLTIDQTLGTADSYGSNRFRATYEITRIDGTVESLPRMVQVTGLGNAAGLSVRSDRRLLVASNNGIANPFCQVFEGTTPYQELFYHFRFGHTANRVVASKVVSGKYYVTLRFSDMTPNYLFDLVLPPETGASQGYDVRQTIPGAVMSSCSTSAPYWIQLSSVEEAERFSPGDEVHGQFGTGTVIDASGDRIYTDVQVVANGYPYFTGTRLAGVPGSDAFTRQLQSPSGLDAVMANGEEYIVIADTGNHRVVVWSNQTRYVTHWDSPDGTAANPAAIAAHPVESGKFYMLDRRSSGSSKLYLFTFDGTTLAVASGYPVTVDVANATSPQEMGLAVWRDPGTRLIHAMLTDAQRGRTVEIRDVGGSWPAVGTYASAQGVYAGSAALTGPRDVAYVPVGRRQQWYVTDSPNRVVLVKEATLPFPPGDLDFDWSVNDEDLRLFEDCMTGPDSVLDFNCGVSDIDEDGDADLVDLAEMQLNASGEPV